MTIQAGDTDEELDQLSEINVTPFIDVMLVLLIIFMVAAPLATVDVPVDLPTSTALPHPQADPIYVSLQSDLSLSIGEQKISRSELAAALDEATRHDRSARILVRADKVVDYGDLMALINEIGRAGYPKVALVGVNDAAPPIVP